MKYKVKITHCAPLISNLKKYEKCELFHDATDTYIEIDNSQELLLIEDIEGYQAATFKKYQQLIAITEK